MLEQKFAEVYTKFKLHFYLETFERFQRREASLTTVDEVVHGKGVPLMDGDL